ncbi:MAG: YbhB/YbcL family Raf kinase inhibitor-like protein [Clostridiales bacterium]|jgi:Raf kinase inhibitor-like YbhB/YbcL family protein|nr:YbhB/YbcL family Raf kinase inhibitor-like protein [Clostridiales bacterium]
MPVEKDYLNARSAFSVTSGFTHGTDMPVQYAYRDLEGGENQNPPLHWSGAPAGTKSFAILMYDLHRVAKNWVHWAVINIPPEADSIPEGVSGSPGIPAGAVELLNSYGEKGYGGPCPPRGSGNHEYRFIVYALRTGKVNIKSPVTADEFMAAVKADALGETEISGLFMQ